MKIGYVLSPKADKDIERIADYLAEEGGLAVGLDFLSEIHKALTLLVLQPELGWRSKIPHPKLADSRTFRVSSRFEKVLIFYRVFDSRIEVIRILHGAQDLVGVFDREE